jgi:acetyl esterase/lipase
VGLAIVLLSVAAGCTDSVTPAPPRQLHAGQSETVNFCGDETADIAVPQHLAGRAPAVIYVHGGGWFEGDPTTGGYLITEIGPALLAEGFVVAAITYRLGDTAPWPAQIQDVACAVRYLRTYARELHVDAHEIGAWGHSAGGHLVSLLGVAPTQWDDGTYPRESSALQAVTSLSGPTDLNTLQKESVASPVKDSFIRLLQPPPADLTAALAAASPVTYVDPGDPPFLLVAGDEDQFVYAEQATEFANVLQANGVPHTLILVTGAGHDLNQAGQDPSPAAITADVVAFFASTLHLPSVAPTGS